MEKLETLFEWQEARLAKKKKEKRLANLSEQFNLTDREQEVQEIEEEHQKGRSLVSELTRELKRKEDEASRAEQQRKEYEKKLYQGEVSVAKELEQLQKKVTQIQKEEARLEEEILENMMKLDNAREEEDKTAIKLKSKRKQLEDTNKAYKEEKQKLEEDIQELENKIENLQEEIEESLRKRCVTLEERAGARGIVPVEDGSCGGCKVSLSAFILEKVKGGKEIVTCESCGRMLFLPSE